MNRFLIFHLLAITFFVSTAFGQEDNSNELIVSDEDQIILFTTAILIVIGIFIFMARNIIRRKKTVYEYREHTESDAKGDIGVLYSLRYPPGRSLSKRHCGGNESG